MITAWRMVKKKREATAFDGFGGFAFGGRWNSVGVRVVYVSSTLALAALEQWVHLDAVSAKGLIFATFEMQLDEGEVTSRTVGSLPADWRAEPAPNSTKVIGDAWVASQASPVLSVPSVIVPPERNYVLNNGNPGFSAISYTQRDDFTFDPRMWK